MLVKWVRVATHGNEHFESFHADVIGHSSLVFSVKACKSARIFLASTPHNPYDAGYDITIESHLDNGTKIVYVTTWMCQIHVEFQSMYIDVYVFVATPVIK